MPFIELVGDQPVYALNVQLTNENPEQFKLIIPVLGDFILSCHSFLPSINGLVVVQ